MAIAVLLEVSALIAGTGWADLEDRFGPLRAASAFALATPLAVLGPQRPVAASRLPLVPGIATVVPSFTPGAGSAPMGAAGVGVVVTGLLYLPSNRSRRPGRRGTSARPCRAALFCSAAMGGRWLVLSTSHHLDSARFSVPGNR